MDVKIEESWKKRLADEFEKDYFKQLTDFVKQEYRQGTVYPPGPYIRGLFERTGARNALDARLAGQILLACQKSMSRVMSGNDDALCPLDTALALLPREKRVQCCFWFNEAQEALGFNVTPARVLEALAARLHVTRMGD